MKEKISLVIVYILTVIIISACCHLVYDLTNLSEVFKTKISYSHWMGITIISTLLVVKPSDFKEKRDDE